MAYYKAIVTEMVEHWTRTKQHRNKPKQTSCADLTQQIIVEQKDNSINVAGTTVDLYGKNGIKFLSYHIPKSIPGRLKYLNVKGKKQL